MTSISINVYGVFYHFVGVFEVVRAAGLEPATPTV